MDQAARSNNPMFKDSGGDQHETPSRFASYMEPAVPSLPPLSNAASVRRRAGSPTIDEASPGTPDGLTLGILNPLFKGSGRAIDLRTLPGFGNESSAPVNSPVPQPAAGRISASGIGSNGSPFTPRQAPRQSNGGSQLAGPPPGLSPITAPALSTVGSSNSTATATGSPYLAAPPPRRSPSGHWLGAAAATATTAAASPLATPMGSIPLADTYSPDTSQQLSRYDSAGSHLSGSSGSGHAYGRMATGGDGGPISPDRRPSQGGGGGAGLPPAGASLEPTSSITTIATITTKQRSSRLSAVTSPSAAAPSAAVAVTATAATAMGAAAAAAGASKNVAFSDTGRAVAATAAAVAPSSPEAAIKSVPAPQVVHGAAGGRKPAAAAPTDPVKAEKVAAAAAQAAGLSTGKKAKKQYRKAAEAEAAKGADPEAARREEEIADAKAVMKEKKVTGGAGLSTVYGTAKSAWRRVAG